MRDPRERACRYGGGVFDSDHQRLRVAGGAPELHVPLGYVTRHIRWLLGIPLITDRRSTIALLAARWLLAPVES